MPPLPSLAQLADSMLPPFDEKARQQMFVGQQLAQMEHIPPALLPEKPAVIWQEGNSELRQYGAAKNPPIVFVPSLVNGSGILDISKERSVLRYLAQQGLNPILLDWGNLGKTEQHFSLNDYQHRLQRAWHHLCKNQQPVALAGYCMGGIFAANLARTLPCQTTQLLLIATPLNFQIMASDKERQRLTKSWPWLQQLLKKHQYLPADILQYFLVARNPQQVAVRYQQFQQYYHALTLSERQHFALIDQWLTNALPLSQTIAIETLQGWYLKAESPVLQSYNGKAYVITGDKDIVVPPAASVLSGKDVTHLAFNTTHLGLVAGRKSLESVWAKVLKAL